MEGIGHDVFGDGAVGLEEDVADIAVENAGVVGEVVEGLVDLEDFAALVVELFSAGEDSEKEDFGFGKFFLEAGDVGADAVEDLTGGMAVEAGIVGADHEDGDTGGEAVDVSVFESPEDALGPVAADADVEGFALAVELLPDFGAGAFPALGDGIADEEEVDFAGVFADAFVEQFEALEGSAGAGFGFGWRGFRGLGVKAGGGDRDGEGEGESGGR